MQIDDIEISKIRPYHQNPRKNDAAVDAVAKSISEYGWRQPIVVDDAGVIIIGHTRFRAALKLGLDRVPVHAATGLAPEKVLALRIADNASHDLSSFDVDLLKIEIQTLSRLDYPVELTFLPEDQIKKLLIDDPGPGTGGSDDPPPKDPNILVRLSFHPEMWLGAREKILESIEKIKKRFICHVKIEE